MTVLRSHKKHDAFNPATPARNRERESYSHTPEPKVATVASAVPVSGPTTRRRSLRLAPEPVSDRSSSRELYAETGIRVSSPGLTERESVSGLIVEGIRVSGEKGGSSRKRRSDGDVATMESFEGVASEGFLNLRSEKRVLKRRMENTGVDCEAVTEKEKGVESNVELFKDCFVANGNLNSDPLEENLDDDGIVRVESKKRGKRVLKDVVQDKLTSKQWKIYGDAELKDSLALNGDLEDQAAAKNVDHIAKVTVKNKNKGMKVGEDVGKEDVTSGFLEDGGNSGLVKDSRVVNSRHECGVMSLGHDAKVENRKKGKQFLKDGAHLNTKSDTRKDGESARNLLVVHEKLLFESEDKNLDHHAKRTLDNKNGENALKGKNVLVLNAKLELESKKKNLENKALPATTNNDVISDKVDAGTINEVSTSKGRRRFTREEKEKGISIEDDPVLNSDEVEKSAVIELKNSICDSVQDASEAEETVKLECETEEEKKKRRNELRTDQFRNIARQNASRFAHFEAWAEDDEDGEIEQEVEDWPGPFSTAMKIIRDREDRMNLRVGPSVSNNFVPLVWAPKRDKSYNAPKPLVPSLQDICITVLARNADAITSLECLPDALKHKLCHLLCDSRRMDGYVLELLLCGTPTEVRLRDCSWITEEEFAECFKHCNTTNLMVLQLDQSGRCLPDYILQSTLASSPNSLPVLSSLSLSGACRLSDVGLCALVSCAPSLRSINLSQCSLLTSSSIDTLADGLGSVLRELYINDCQSIDAMLILTALKKFKNLEVLSLAGVQTVRDRFISEFVTAQGQNLKELILTDCGKLTDSSVKFIAENCPALRSLDLGNLWKLTDSALSYLSNGCRAMQKLKLCRNSFSDEAMAAFLETAGEYLKELSLNNVKKVNHNTALSIARRSTKLQTLDLSWCRNLTDEAMGLIVDSCLSLIVLKLFGCTQITNVFLDGHSNLNVQIIGLRMSPILNNHKVP